MLQDQISLVYEDRSLLHHTNDKITLQAISTSEDSHSPASVRDANWKSRLSVSKGNQSRGCCFDIGAGCSKLTQPDRLAINLDGDAVRGFSTCLLAPYFLGTWSKLPLRSLSIATDQASSSYRRGGCLILASMAFLNSDVASEAHFCCGPSKLHFPRSRMKPSCRFLSNMRTTAHRSTVHRRLFVDNRCSRGAKELQHRSTCKVLAAISITNFIK